MYRYCIYPKEISVILGKSYSYSCKLTRSIKDAYQIHKRRDITIKEFCEYMNLPYEEIFNTINKRTIEST
ncbi:MAG: hypothetical protein COW44_00620 [Flavobacteriaceae bacterium CG17_big_fil_post_rev_8_21_14_2_50_33_15]|nr:MAG: hypothetical protein COW44_00620 [Flavobacteriaceae bacterium CG17_big_fil_post_rev_8_21_14_2_50_33_15]